MKVIGIILLWFAASSQGAVKVSVFYESLCPDSIAFIKYQLYPTWLQLTELYMEIDFVPYGKATQSRTSNGTWMFHCQHGAEECRGNMEQACALSVLSHNATAQVQFIACVMSTRNPPNAGPQCSSVLGINYNPIQSCKTSYQGGDLLAALGDRTHSFSPRISFVPTVAFNDVYNQTDQDESMHNLLRVVCRHIVGNKPAPCYS